MLSETVFIKGFFFFQTPHLKKFSSPKTERRSRQDFYHVSNEFSFPEPSEVFDIITKTVINFCSCRNSLAYSCFHEFQRSFIYPFSKRFQHSVVLDHNEHHSFSNWEDMIAWKSRRDHSREDFEGDLIFKERFPVVLDREHLLPHSPH